MKKTRILSLLLAGALTLTGLYGCSSSSSSSDSEQVLNAFYMDVDSLDPNACSDSNTSSIIGAVQEGLFRIYTDEDGNTELQEAGAESYEVSDDGLTYTFHLREYYWSDGEQVTAQQYVDSILRLIDPNEAFEYAYFAYDIAGAEAYNEGTGSVDDVGVEALDDTTLQITLSEATPYFLSKMAYTVFLPIRLDLIEEYGDDYATDYENQVYCGPFKIESWDYGNSMTLVKNEDYWDADSVSLDEISFQDIQQTSTRSQLFDSEELDFFPLLSAEYVEEYTEKAEDGESDIISEDNTGVYYLAFNQDSESAGGILSNAKIRLAIGLALDREEYVTDITERYSAAYGLIPTTISSGVDDELYRDVAEEPLVDDAEEYSTDEALQELFHEGLQELGLDTDDLSTITLTYLSNDDTDAGTTKNEWIQQQIESALGINIEVEVQGDFALFLEEYDNQNYDFLLTGWGADYDDPMTFLDMWTTDNGNNHTGYSNSEYDELVASLAGESDTSTRLEIYEQLEEILLEDAVISPIYYGDNQVAVQSYVSGLQMPAFGPLYEFKWVSIDN